MFDEIGRQLLSNGFLPHGYCISWSPALLWTYVVSDILIFVAYFSMPLALALFLRKRPNFAYKWLLWMFAAFILACGTTHLIGVLLIWQPLYWVDAALKALTALISVATAIVLWPMIPHALLAPGQDQLRAINEELRKEIAERLRVEEELRMANEALLKSNLNLQHFAHVAAHDLQTPLRTVSIYVQLLQRELQGKLSEQSEQWMGWVWGATDRMQALVDDLLAYTRLDAQARPFEPVDCQRVFDEAKANLAERIEKSGAEVTRGELPSVMGDRIQLAQVIQNLIENGIKYNTSTTPRVTVSAERQGKEWIFAVADNGIGIDPKYHERIFEIFRRLHTQSEYPGTGIGLAICEKVVGRHAGRMWVESQPGAGSTFYFSLPVADELDKSQSSLAQA